MSKPDWPEPPFETVVKSNLIGQNHPVNQGNPLYNWVQNLTEHNRTDQEQNRIEKNIFISLQFAAV